MSLLAKGNLGTYHCVGEKERSEYIEVNAYSECTNASLFDDNDVVRSQPSIQQFESSLMKFIVVAIT